MAELTLDDDERHSFVGRLHSVRVTELMRGEPAPRAGYSRRPPQLGASGSR
jgi:hypothetical protein